MREIYLNYTNPSNSFMILHRKEFGNFNMRGCHSHKRYEVFYLVDGERYFFIKDRSFLINQGDLVFINTLELHKTSDTGKPDPETIIMEFDPGFISNHYLMPNATLDYLFNNNTVLRLPLNKRQFVNNLLHNIMQEIKNGDLDFELSVQSVLQQLLIYVARNVAQNQLNKPSTLSPNHFKITEIVNYMNQNFPEGLSLESVGAAFAINPYYLSRIFRKVTGFTFIEYLNSLRIKEAQRLLRETDTKVVTIANAVGFENQSHFGRVFKSIIGISPLQYRKNNNLKDYISPVME
ncbi:MAG TPA: AraC family transcriptional regulator [Bacillota bacterium]|nr:AraC family transcriptional regulator [Bacillota bacterium]